LTNPPRFGFRAVTDHDQQFLLDLYALVSGQELSLLPITEPQRDQLIVMQFEAQRRAYREQYPNSQEWLIMVEGKAAGRFWFTDTTEEILVIDLAIHSEYQRHGLARAVLQKTIETAAHSQKPVRLTVRRDNFAALGLYRTLGFKVVSEDDLFVHMKCSSSNPH